MSETSVTHRRGEYAGPLSPGITSGRLVFERGTANDVVVIDPDLTDLFIARFDGAVPRVQVTGGVVRMRHARGRPNRGWIALSGRVPWALEVHGGAARLRAELAQGEITELEVSGGASHVDLDLPAPGRRVPVRFGGGISQVSVLRPRDVPVRLSMGGGAARIALDDQRFGAVGGPLELQSGRTDVDGGYDVHVGGGAHALTIATR
jgi:hypothetical protein